MKIIETKAIIIEDENLKQFINKKTNPYNDEVWIKDNKKIEDFIKNCIKDYSIIDGKVISVGNIKIIEINKILCEVSISLDKI